MKLFRPRGRHEAGQPARSPLAPATALYEAGRYAEAEAEARAVAAARSGRRNDPYAPLAMSLAALAIGAQGCHTEAVTAYDALLPVFGRIFGAEHPQTLKLRSDRAQALTASILPQALSRTRSACCPTHRAPGRSRAGPSRPRAARRPAALRSGGPYRAR
ncbi:hypothetical protein [Streptomyces sp. NPDC058572]|uniref:hypothetical protein n=1 Tax=Streptomyces sp. NPDC058572 TaxID=3346546 RepID=UPI00365DAB2A